MMNPRGSKHVGEQQKLNINLKKFAFRWFVLCNYTTMQGAKKASILHILHGLHGYNRASLISVTLLSN